MLSETDIDNHLPSTIKKIYLNGLRENKRHKSQRVITPLRSATIKNMECIVNYIII